MCGLHLRLVSACICLWSIKAYLVLVLNNSAARDKSAYLYIYNRGAVPLHPPTAITCSGQEYYVHMYMYVIPANDRATYCTL